MAPVDLGAKSFCRNWDPTTPKVTLLTPSSSLSSATDMPALAFSSNFAETTLLNSFSFATASFNKGYADAQTAQSTLFKDYGRIGIYEPVTSASGYTTFQQCYDKVVGTDTFASVVKEKFKTAAMLKGGTAVKTYSTTGPYDGLVTNWDALTKTEKKYNCGGFCF